MTDIIWTEDLAVGVPTLDAQHKQLLRILSRLRQVLGSEREEATLRLALEDLKRYAVYHFGAEEALMRSKDCPGWEEHQAQHQEFAERMQGFDDERLAGSAKAARDLVDYLAAWVVEHIQNVDKAMAPCLESPFPD